MRLILGSESKWRRELFAEMGYSFDVVAPGIDEKAIRDNRPEVLTMKLAEAKSKALRPMLRGEYLLVTADQVVTVNSNIREKPETYAQMHMWLETAHLAPAVCCTAIAVYNSKREYMIVDVDIATIHFKEFPHYIIELLVDQKEMMNCAGGFTCEHPLIDPYISKVEGCRDSIQGFPKHLVKKLLNKVR